MTLLDLQSTACRYLAAAQLIYLVLFGAAMRMWLVRRGVDVTLFSTIVCFLPALLCLVLALTSTADPRQYTMRVLACAMFTPILLLFWAGSQDGAPGRVWPIATATAVAHAAVFVGTVFWGGTITTRVPAQPGSIAASADSLRMRLVSLNAASLPFEVATLSPEEIQVSFRFPSNDRSHQALLRLDPATHRVRVRERLSDNAARPKDASEASMRGPGDPAFDPTRPNATSVSNTVAQTTMIEFDKLTAVPIVLHDRSVEVHRADTQLDGEGMVTLLCAVVTGSGWSWEPVFFGN